MAEHHHVFHGRSGLLLAITILMWSLSTLFIIGRFVSRGAIVKRIMRDDYIIGLAWTIATGLSIGVCLAAANGLGRHEMDVPPDWTRTLRKAIYAVSVMYQPSLMATKTSILVFYLSLSAGDRTFKWACIATLVVVNAGGFALTMGTIFQCRPVSAVFDLVLPAGAQCTDVLTIYLASVPLNLITDLALLLLPMPIITAMRLPMKQKIILVVTFSAGLFVAVVDVVRISYLQDASEARLSAIQRLNGQTTAITAEMIDSSWFLSYTYLWTAIEVHVGIMCACVPALKPLVARFLPAMLKDPGETSRAASAMEKSVAVDMNSPPDVNSRVEYPDDVHTRDFGGSLDSGVGGPMDMIDFLTTPDMNEGEAMRRTTTAMTNTSRHTAPPASATFFDFVNVKRHKSMVQMTHRESIFPISMVTLLFFIWGFEYGLLNVLNRQFQIVANVTSGQTAAIHSAYFAGYFAGPWTVGRLVLKHWGFRSCFPIGMFIYAAGLLIFWPAAVLTSWPTFVVTNFIVGFGLSILETGCNPFIMLCGPPGYGEIRLNISQGLQGIGSIVAPLIAEKAFLGRTDDAPSLVNTQWAYLGMSLATVILGMIYVYIPLPNATDAELADADERVDRANEATIPFVGGRRISIIWISLGLAVFSQFCYVGGQEVNATIFASYFPEVIYPDSQASTLSTSTYSAIAHTAFAVSRFAAAGLGFFIKPRYLLAFFSIGAVVFTALSMRFTGDTAIACFIMAYFMEGPVFALIFALGLRGMGRHTRLASVALTSAISGGAVFSPISSALVNQGRSASFALVVGAVVFAAGCIYPLTLSSVPKLSKIVDYPKADDLPGSQLSASSLSSRHSSPTKHDWGGRRRRTLESITRFHGGEKARHRTEVEHRERGGSVG
jgi:fucose permease